MLYYTITLWQLCRTSLPNLRARMTKTNAHQWPEWTSTSRFCNLEKSLKVDNLCLEIYTCTPAPTRTSKYLQRLGFTLQVGSSLKPYVNFQRQVFRLPNLSLIWKELCEREKKKTFMIYTVQSHGAEVFCSLTFFTAVILPFPLDTAILLDSKLICKSEAVNDGEF